MARKISMAVIAAAGQATRMWPASKVVPKELFPLGKIPAIVHIVWEMLEAGIEKVVIVASPFTKPLVEALIDPKPAPLEKIANDPQVERFVEAIGRGAIEVIEQQGNYGNGTPLLIAIRQFGAQPCIYAFGDDVVVGENASRGLLDVYERTGNPVMGAQAVAPARKSSFGILECVRRKGDAYIRRVLEKPKPGETASNLASFGRYLVTPRVLQILEEVKPGKDGEIWFIDAIDAHLKSGGEVCAFSPKRGTWYTVGDPKSYSKAVTAATREQLELTADGGEAARSKSGRRKSPAPASGRRKRD